MLINECISVGYQGDDLAKSIGKPIQQWQWTLSMWVRIFIPMYAPAVAFMMICTESDTTQLLLDYTSIEFVRNLDNASTFATHYVLCYTMCLLSSISDLLTILLVSIFFRLKAYEYLGFGAQRA